LSNSGSSVTSVSEIEDLIDDLSDARSRLRVELIKCDIDQDNERISRSYVDQLEGRINRIERSLKHLSFFCDRRTRPTDGN
jgi:cytochrome oxidase Cu insertion factor (SCO1/SenC/PrrC family)